MTEKDQRILKLIEGAFLTARLFESNGRLDGADGKDIEEGWDEIMANIGHDVEHLSYMRTFYENGWYEGRQKYLDSKKVNVEL